MNRFTCSAARRHLDAYHDQELPLADQIAMERHLRACSECAALLMEMRMLRLAFVASLHSQPPLAHDEQLSFQSSVITRLRAERTAALSTRLENMFEDMRLVYAGLGATAAAVACVLMTFNITQLLADEQPGSLAGVVSALAAKAEHVLPASPLPVIVDARMLTSISSGLVLAADSDLMTGDAGAEFSLRAVVTREGRVSNVELLHARSGQPVAPDTVEARVLRPLVSAVAKARFEPASVDGLPVASNIMLNVPHTTVRATKGPVATNAPPPSKKRAFWVPGAVTGLRISSV
jgi:putative zinc finger protein